MPFTTFLGLRTAQYHVADLSAARDWYAKAIGSEPYFDDPFYVGFDVGGFELGLIPGGPSRGVTGTVSAYWGVPSVEDAHRALLALGAQPVGAIEDVGHGIRKATVLDPFGNPLGIIENPHFKATAADG